MFCFHRHTTGVSHVAKKKTSQEWDESSTGAYLSAQFTARAVEGDAQDASVAAASTVGLRLPFLSQRLLFQRSSLPLGRSVIIYGPSGSNKSSLLYEFYGLFQENKGKYFHLNVEDKDTPTFRLSLTKYDRDAGEVRDCETLDDYQEEVEKYLNWYASLVAKKDGPGKICPVIIGIDSLCAKMTRDAASKVTENDGRTERRFADEARALSDWFKYVPSKMTGLPICLFAVNHDKPQKNAQTGQLIHNAPGGAAPNYYATYKIFAERSRTLKQSADGWEGNRIRMTMHKNSIGADGQQIEVEIVWRTRAVESKSGSTTVRQDTVWNWHKATVEHLYRLQGVDGMKRMGKRGAAVNDLLEIRKGSGGRFSSKPLGVPSSDPIKPYNLGKLIEANTDVLKQLEPMLGIHPSTAFVYGLDYDKQVAEAVVAIDDIIPVDAGQPVSFDEEDDGEE